eukprot:scaffold21154_cov35-Phaeocystis_antarctica.AAC.2
MCGPSLCDPQMTFSCSSSSNRCASHIQQRQTQHDWRERQGASLHQQRGSLIRPQSTGATVAGGTVQKQRRAGAQTGDESAKRHGEKDRLTLMGRIRTESHAKWPKSGGSGQFLRSWRVSVCVRERQQTSRWVGR